MLRSQIVSLRKTKKECLKTKIFMAFWGSQNPWQIQEQNTQPILPEYMRNTADSRLVSPIQKLPTNRRLRKTILKEMMRTTPKEQNRKLYPNISVNLDTLAWLSVRMSTTQCQRRNEAARLLIARTM
jgi:hypothetical protein